MTAEPVFFAVVRRHGVESPRLFYERIPPDLLRNGAALVYATRLDVMDAGERLIEQPLAQLFAVFLALRKAGKLPTEDRGVKPKPPSSAPVYQPPPPLEG